jgi:hypothetical protein
MMGKNFARERQRAAMVADLGLFGAALVQL